MGAETLSKAVNVGLQVIMPLIIDLTLTIDREVDPVQGLQEDKIIKADLLLLIRNTMVIIQPTTCLAHQVHQDLGVLQGNELVCVVGEITKVLLAEHTLSIAAPTVGSVTSVIEVTCASPRALV